MLTWSLDLVLAHPTLVIGGLSWLVFTFFVVRLVGMNEPS
jgi:hypothetical protein